MDRSITLSFALIVPDEVFDQVTAGDYSTYVNATLSAEQTDGKSLIHAVMDVNKKLNQTSLSFESYLQNIGRQLFYVVAASYITIYLAIVFLIIANTVIGVQFLTQLQRTKRRYHTLVRIGATYHSMCYSVKKQISWYFGIPVLIAAVSPGSCVARSESARCQWLSNLPGGQKEKCNTSSCADLQRPDEG